MRGGALNAESLRHKATKCMALGAAQAKRSHGKADTRGRQAGRVSSASSDGSDSGVIIAWGQAGRGQTARRSQGLDPTRPQWRAEGKAASSSKGRPSLAGEGVATTSSGPGGQRRAGCRQRRERLRTSLRKEGQSEST